MINPVMEGTTEVGYTITFTKSSPVAIMHSPYTAHTQPIVKVTVPATANPNETALLEVTVVGQ